MKMQMHRYRKPDDNFIITSPTYHIFKQSTLPPFLQFMEGLGHYDRKEERFIMYNGGTCWFRTGKNPDSVVGMTNVRAILCDEAGLYSLYFWENIQGRSSFCQAPIRIVTSPYSLNWLYKDYIKPKRRDPESLPDVELIQATSKENPYFPADEYEAKRLTMDSRRFNMMYGGEFDKMQGLVYDCFDEDLNSAELFQFPSGTQFFGGIDWGYTEPFVLVIHAILPNGYRFQVSETYHSGLTLPEIGEICIKKMQTWGVKRFYAGPDQPGSIEYLCRIGCPTVGANNDIRVGVDTFYELIKTRRYKVIKGTSPKTIDEFDTYHYPDPKDLKPDQSTKEAKPVGQNDHAMDANRYVIVMTHRSNVKLTPKVPNKNKKQLTEEQEIKELQRLKRRVL
jgi:phage terminase large subunit